MKILILLVCLLSTIAQAEDRDKVEDTRHEYRYTYSGEVVLELGDNMYIVPGTGDVIQFIPQELVMPTPGQQGDYRDHK